LLKRGKLTQEFRAICGHRQRENRGQEQAAIGPEMGEEETTFQDAKRPPTQIRKSEIPHQQEASKEQCWSGIDKKRETQIRTADETPASGTRAGIPACHYVRHLEGIPSHLAAEQEAWPD